MNFPTGKLPVPSTITNLSDNASGAALQQMALGSLNGSTVLTANRAVFYSFILDQTIIVQSLFFANGSSVTGNIDLGIYSQDGTKIISTGSTAISGTSALQVISITPLTLGPGIYYMAHATSGASNPVVLTATANLEPVLTGQALQASAFPLPATATFASYTGGGLALMGLATVITV